MRRILIDSLPPKCWIWSAVESPSLEERRKEIPSTQNGSTIAREILQQYFSPLGYRWLFESSLKDHSFLSSPCGLPHRVLRFFATSTVARGVWVLVYSAQFTGNLIGYWLRQFLQGGNGNPSRSMIPYASAQRCVHRSSF